MEIRTLSCRDLKGTGQRGSFATVCGGRRSSHGYLEAGNALAGGSSRPRSSRRHRVAPAQRVSEIYAWVTWQRSSRPPSGPRWRQSLDILDGRWRRSMELDVFLWICLSSGPRNSLLWRLRSVLPP
eukprot:364779-Chlamydomonas_euryale.AAC.6